MASYINVTDNGATTVVLNQGGNPHPVTTGGTDTFRARQVLLDADGQVQIVLDATHATPPDLGGYTLAGGDVITFPAGTSPDTLAVV